MLCFSVLVFSGGQGRPKRPDAVMEGHQKSTLFKYFQRSKLLVSIPRLLSPSPHQQPRSDREAEFAIILWLQNPPPPPLQKTLSFRQSAAAE